MSGHEYSRRKAAAEAARRIEYFILGSDAPEGETEEYWLGEDNQCHSDLRRLIAAARLEVQREHVNERREGLRKVTG